MKRLRLLTWHVHGNYLWNLTQLPHEFFLVTDPARSPGHAGRSGTLPWGGHVHEVAAHAVRAGRFDAVIYQHRAAWDDERHRLLSPAQRRLPALYLEHDPPQQHPTDTRHWADEPEVTLVHVTHFNALMWATERCRVQVVEHGVRLLHEARWHGTDPRGLVVVNHLARRGRRLGLDLFRQAAQQLPLSLVGMGSEQVGGEGEVAQQALPARLAQHRFFFHPVRYTSLGLAAIEAMLVGAPLVGLATTELATVLRDGETGFVDNRLPVLVERMRVLQAQPALARQIGAAGRAMARERFGIERFVSDWQRVLAQACG